MEFAEIEHRLSKVIDSLKSQIPERVYRQTVEVITAGEYGVAIENLCNNLFEFDVVVPKDSFDEIEALGLAMGLPSSTWENIAVL